MRCVEETYQAYEWLAMQTPRQDTVVICNDAARLDQILRSMAKAEAGEKPQVGSHRVVSDLRCMLTVPKRLVWLDCQGGYGLRYGYDFLSRSDIAHWPGLATEEQMLAAVHGHLVRMLNGADECLLIAARRDVGQPLTEHPMVAALTHSSVPLVPQELEVKIPLQKTQHSEIRFTPQFAYQLPNGMVHCEDKVVSYSTLDHLIDFPFNYAMESVAHLPEPRTKNALAIIKGNVAHKLTELMVNEHHCIDLSLYDKLSEQAIQTMGRDLLRPEYRFELEEFHASMQESLRILAQIIEANHLTLVEDEYKLGWETPVQLDIFGDSKASIDLLLRDERDGRYVIFDFKYSMSEDNYKEMLRKNRSLQFAFYKEIFDRCSTLGEVKAMGYYLFPLSTLFVPEGTMGSDHLKGENIEAVPLEDAEQVSTTNAFEDLLSHMRASYEVRIAELKRGYIEEAEGMPLSKIPYCDHIAKGEELVPLSHKYKDDKSKGTPYAPVHRVMKNQIR